MISLLNSLFVSVLFADMLERRFPTEFKNFFINLSYNSIYFYSKLQIYIFKLKNKINAFIESNQTLLKLKEDINKILINSKKNYNGYMLQSVKNGQLYNSVIEDYDFIICNDMNEKCISKKLFYEKDFCQSKFEHSDIKFLLIEFKIGDNNSYKIDLKTDDFNYYLVDNKFTKNFFIFYIKYYYSITESIINDDKCSLKIIDHDVNNIEIDFTDNNDSIILEKNGYKLEIINQSDKE